MIHIGTKAECDELQVLVDKVYGPYPRPPTRIVGATKKTITPVWNGTGTPPFGWTAHHVVPAEHPTNNGTWAVDLPDPDVAKEVVLSGAERAILASRRATAVTELPQDWTPAESVLLEVLAEERP